MWREDLSRQVRAEFAAARRMLRSPERVSDEREYATAATTAPPPPPLQSARRRRIVTTRRAELVSAEES